MCVCVWYSLYRPFIQAQRERERNCLGLYTHMLLYIYTHTRTRHHLICIAKFRRDFIMTPWASEERNEKAHTKKEKKENVGKAKEQDFSI